MKRDYKNDLAASTLILGCGDAEAQHEIEDC